VEWTYTMPRGSLGLDTFAYGGRWTVEGERIVAGHNARLALQFQARDIFLVLEGKGTVDVSVDGSRVRSVAISGLPRLHTLVRFPELRRGLLELRFSPGVAAYAFTFG